MNNSFWHQLLCGLVLACLSGAPVLAQSSPPIPYDTSFTPQSTYLKERKNFPNVELVTPQLPRGVAWEKDVVYREIKDTPYGDRQLHADIFHPKKTAAGPYPAVLLIHGGGWRSGSKFNLIPMAQQLAAAGYVTLAVEYRLALEALYPASLVDIKAAIRWLRAHAREYHVDPEKIAVLGCSSGAQVVTLIGTTPSDPQFEGGAYPDQSSDVQAIVNIDGVVSFIHPEAEAEVKGNSASTWLGARYEENPTLWTAASPLEHVSAQTPPILFVNSSIPRFHAGRDDFFQKLDAYGTYHEVHTLPDTPHPFWLLHPWFKPTVGYVRGFLDKVFKE
ncbi:Acetyl esterase/lipase [Catalinimonas alkaloidigena]|uniref:Acetyl esterase/lipase n=1 Tax=Catalinimonas alkaloidigena TaxID=1075417 RepID=A0A1G9PF03_9BACT|nr:alpha/beta hydrolase [Catalinimonas alkaloidigena]SDL97294.1 Acetyl esterase/lipase [Catalinimonas alkaloidigena]